MRSVLRQRETATSDVRIPDFFIVGAPRCGTTFLYEYLRQHPQVFMPERKEPHFFCTDLDSGSYLDSVTFLRDPGEYLALFQPATDGQRVGEASTWYLYSKVAATEIAQFNPTSRIIIMLRDPVEMLYSLHGRRVYGGSENLGFSEALAAEDNRKRGLRIPPRARNVQGLFYREVGRYAEQVERYLVTFGRDRVKIVIFEEFRADPGAAYRETLQFLGIDPDFTPQFEVVNASSARRSWRLQQLLLSPTVVRLGRMVIPRSVRPRVGPLIDRLNSREHERPPMDGNLRARLHAELSDDVARLSLLLGRDLTAIWS